MEYGLADLVFYLETDAYYEQLYLKHRRVVIKHSETESLKKVGVEDDAAYVQPYFPV